MKKTLPILLTMPAAMAAAAEKAPSAEWTVRLKGTPSCAQCPAQVALEFECKNAAKDVSFIQRIENDTTSVRSFEVVGEHLVVMGEVSGAADLVTLVDLPSRTVVDELLSYQAALSPGKRYLVFKGHYPRFAPPEEQSDVVMVYDLQRAPLDNRVAGAQKSRNRENGGRPVFPPENVTAQSLSPSPKDIYVVDPHYAWKDDERLAFLANGEKTGYSLTIVRLGEGAPQACTRPLDKKEYMAPGAGAEGRLAPLRMAFGEKGELEVETTGDGRVKKTLQLTTDCMTPGREGK